MVGKTVQNKVKLYSLAKRTLILMEEAANRVKYSYIGYKTRKLYRQVRSHEKNYTSIKWTGPGSNVQLIGNMTNPPWTVRLQMDYCCLRRIHVKYFARLKQGVYYYNYVVDGRMCVDTSRSAISYMRVKCNQLKVDGRSYQNKEGGMLNWYDFKGVPGKFEIGYVSQKAFQVKDFAETSEEYDLFNEVLRKSNGRTRSSNKQYTNHKEVPASLKDLDKSNRNAKEKQSKAFKKYRDIEINRYSTEGFAEKQLRQRQGKEWEDKYNGGRAGIAPNMAYDNYGY
eukprot:TRINITY_DN8658_c0_g1_i19.p1 TRINITY_DN8658_c0_g1~~TRINITY_DN8658_c0_g1_i19.p1  ORF type:complete len:282 (-),score=48.03 TRINITY_DN8658_c0_g1_i19:153-998(-)